MTDIRFYFDLGSPYAYLTAERLAAVIPGPVTWQPVLLGGLFKLTGRSSWALGDYQRRQRGMADIERRARSYGLPPLRWPDPWPSDYLFAMRAATYAFATGRGHEFVMQAYRDAFQAGADLSITAQVLQAGRQAGIDAAELESGAHGPEIKTALKNATDAAYGRGVIGVPTLAIDNELFWGDDRLEEAAALAAAR